MGLIILFLKNAKTFYTYYMCNSHIILVLVNKKKHYTSLMIGCVVHRHYIKSYKLEKLALRGDKLLLRIGSNELVMLLHRHFRLGNWIDFDIPLRYESIRSLLRSCGQAHLLDLP